MERCLCDCDHDANDDYDFDYDRDDDCGYGHEILGVPAILKILMGAYLLNKFLLRTQIVVLFCCFLFVLFCA